MFKHKWLMVLIILAGSLILAALPSLTAHASPSAPGTFILTQPDGTTFTAIQWGDEFNNGIETEDGYSILQDPASGYWVYLTLNSDGNLISVASDNGDMLIVGRDSPEGLLQHLRPTAPVGNPLLDISEGSEPSDSPPAMGTHHAVVLLAGFPNATGRTSAAYWANLIFGGTGSLKNYYETASYGALTLAPAIESSGTANDGVIGWLDLSTWYAQHPNPGSTLNDVNKYITKRSLQKADGYINYASYDFNHNGSISSDELHIIVVVAGFERSYSANSPSVWAHNGSLDGVGAPTLDSVVIGNSTLTGYYIQVGEMHAEHNGTMGVIAHELGHDLRWPDLYDNDFSSYGVGNWSVMGTGSWNGYVTAGDSPALPDAWSKWYQGWLTPTTISGASNGQNILQSETSQTAYLLRPNPTAVDWLYSQHAGQGEYFLVENRQLVSYDVALPGCGILIWHIDEAVRYDNYANANENHPLVKLIEADGLNQMKLKINRGNPGDAYPGSTTNRNFTVYTTPNSKLYNNTDSYVRVTNISDCAAIMTADMLFGYPVPTLDWISPSYSAPSSSGFTLKLYGSDFIPSSIVRWDGSDRTTYYVSSTELHASIPASDMIALGGVGNSAAVTVFNPQPGGGVSNSLNFFIIDPATIIPRGFFPAMYYEFTANPGYIIKMHQDFEGNFPTPNWEILEFGVGDYRWTKRTCRAASGSFSGWAVGGGADGGALACGSNYPNSVDSYITYGPFSTEEGILNGEVVFKMFLKTEPGFDYFWVTANVGGSTEWGYKVSGNSGGWINGTLNLNNVNGLGKSVIGYPKVWFRFRFTSDYLMSVGEGAFVDDIVLRVCKSAYCNPYSTSPSLPWLNLETSIGDLVFEPASFTIEP